MHTFAPYLAAFAVVGIIYGSLVCLSLARPGAKGDLKRLIAYSSVGHMGFVLLGIATLTPTGVNGALFANIAHGLITGLLFFLVGALKERTGTTDLDTPLRRDGRRAVRQGAALRRAARLRRRRLARAARTRRLLGRDAAPCSARTTPPPGSAVRPSSPSWSSAPSAPCSPPPTCSSSYAASAWATRRTPRGPASRTGTRSRVRHRAACRPPPDLRRYEYAAWTPLVVLTVAAGLWPAALLGLTDPAVQNLLPGVTR